MAKTRTTTQQLMGEIRAVGTAVVACSAYHDGHPAAE
jgi:hypothetical protein